MLEDQMEKETKKDARHFLTDDDFFLGPMH